MPLPFIPPSEPIESSTPPTGADWSHELKWDGYRCQAHVVNGTATLLSKNGKPLDSRFRSIQKSVAALPCRSAVIDAEIVAMDPKGRPDFRSLHGGQRHGLVLACFDLLERNGKDLRALPLIERRMHLAMLLDKADISSLPFSESFDDPIALLEAANRMGLEGIVSKQTAQPYKSGRNRGWIKVKCHAWRAAHADRGDLFKK